jgi:muramoyltetrapeptide carboxypeptidase
VNIRYPTPLRPGARIAVTAPSSGVEPAHHARLELALGHLRAQGYVVEEGECLRAQTGDASAPAQARAAELMRLLLREDIDAIFPPWGGELAIELLHRLDWPALVRARPKWLIGYSDSSTWILPITLRLGWATAHGPCLMDWVPGQDDSLTGPALAHLGLAAGSSFVQAQSTGWQRHWTDFALKPGCTYDLTEPTRWRALRGGAVAGFAGRLVGGCLDTLMHLAGTPYGDVPGFVRGCGRDGAILYLENAEQSPVAVVRALLGLRAAGWFDGVAGVLIGRSAAADGNSPTGLRYADALDSALGLLPCPVLVDVDVGHLPPQMLLVNGARASVEYSPAHGGRITQTLA